MGSRELIEQTLIMILPQLLLVCSSMIVSSRCQEFDNYDYENSPNSVEFGAPSRTPRPTTRSPSPPPRTTPTYPSAPTRSGRRTTSPPYWWMNSTGFSKVNQSSAGIDGKSESNPGYKYKPQYKPRYKPGSGYKPGYKPGLIPPVKSIKIYECEGWAMRCEYRPSQTSQYPLHCQFVPGTSEDF